jgi:hypothetical protein
VRGLNYARTDVGDDYGHVDLPGKATAVSVRFKVDGPRLDVLYAVNEGRRQRRRSRDHRRLIPNQLPSQSKHALA